MHALVRSRTLKAWMDTNARAVLGPSLLGFLIVMQTWKDHTLIWKSFPCNWNAYGHDPIIFKKLTWTLDWVFVMLSFYSDVELIQSLGKSLEHLHHAWKYIMNLSLHFIKRMLLQNLVFYNAPKFRHITMIQKLGFLQCPKAGTKNFHITKCRGFILDSSAFFKKILNFWQYPPWCGVRGGLMHLGA